MRKYYAAFKSSDRVLYGALCVFEFLFRLDRERRQTQRTAALTKANIPSTAYPMTGPATAERFILLPLFKGAFLWYNLSALIRLRACKQSLIHLPPEGEGKADIEFKPCLPPLGEDVGGSRQMRERGDKLG